MNQDFALAGQLGVRGFPTIIMVNEENKGVKIVGARTLQDYANGLKQAMDDKEIQPKAQPKLSTLLENEELLSLKEVEVMYDLQQNEIASFVQEELSPDTYNQKDILGEAYIERK